MEVAKDWEKRGMGRCLSRTRNTCICGFVSSTCTRFGLFVLHRLCSLTWWDYWKNVFIMLCSKLIKTVVSPWVATLILKFAFMYIPTQNPLKPNRRFPIYNYYYKNNSIDSHFNPSPAFSKPSLFIWWGCRDSYHFNRMGNLCYFH